MTAVASLLPQGQLVSVQSRQSVVKDGRPRGLPRSVLKTAFAKLQHFLIRSSVEGDSLLSGFAPPDKLDAFLNPMRWVSNRVLAFVQPVEPLRLKPQRKKVKGLFEE